MSADNNFHTVLKREHEDAEPEFLLECWQSKRPKYTGTKLPSIFELASLINQPLSYEEKIPIPTTHIRQLITHDLDVDSCREDDVKLLFRNGGLSNLSGKLSGIETCASFWSFSFLMGSAYATPTETPLQETCGQLMASS